MDTNSVIDSIINLQREQEECYYTVVGCDELSSTEQIQTEYRKRAKELHPDKNGPTDDEKFKQLQEAKETLCDSKKRMIYDRWRRSGLKVPFKVWKTMSGNANMSPAMHWRPAPCKQPMLTSANYVENNNNNNNTSTYTADELLRKFRNYEI